MQSFAQPKAVRREAISRAGTGRGGKLLPVSLTVFREGEGGLQQQSVNVNLDPIPGRLITAITGRAVTVMVPSLAMDALKNQGGQFPGNADIYRDKLTSGTPVFDLEPENEISRRIGVEPIKIAGQQRVSEVVRLAHNAAVNYLRRKLFVKAAQLNANSTAITPALLSQTALDRLGGVLQPEDRVNGMVNFKLQDKDLRVKGLGYLASGSSRVFEPNANVYETGGQTTQYEAAYHAAGIRVESAQGDAFPRLYAELRDLGTQGVSLADFYAAQRMDELTRRMRKVIDENPELGESIVARLAAGLAVDTGDQPYVVYDQERQFFTDPIAAQDGPSLGKIVTEAGLQFDITVPVPRTEFGGVLITFISVTPDETLASQPHPQLTKPWTAPNHIADELVVDPVPVTIRELDSDCAAADEETVAFYARNHWEKELYLSWGFNRQIDPTTVEAETAVWQLEIPTSVTPENVLYPENLNHNIFADRQAEVVRYVVETSARITTPTVFGPAPVEELETLETFDVFDDQ